MGAEAQIGLSVPYEEVRAFCERWGVTELALFGSVLRDDFRPESDVDVLVTFRPGSGTDLSAYLAMERELSAMLARPVDLVDRRAIEQSPNWLRRRRILDSARVVYAA